MLGGTARTTRGGQSVWLLGVVALAMGCSIFGDDSKSDDDDDGGDGGQSGESTGGTTSKGGSSGNGGSISNGGSVSNGGSNGGSISNGGSVSNGGSNGGSSSNGGSGGDLVMGGTGGDLSVGGSISNGGSSGSVSNGGSGGSVGGSSGAGGGPSGACGEVFNVEAGGYVTSPGSSCWRGYAFNVTDSLGTTITPADFAACASPTCLCASGSVIDNENYEGYASIGFNLNQEPTLGATEGTTTPAGTGITISYTNTGGSSLRVQIASGGTRWCYDNLTGTGGTVTIPYSSFNTECWVGGDGTAFTGGAISSVQLVVPGNLTPVSYSICLLGAKDG